MVNKILNLFLGLAILSTSPFALLSRVQIGPIEKAKEVRNQVEERVRQETQGEVKEIQQKVQEGIEDKLKEGTPEVTKIVPSPPRIQENLRERFKNIGENHRSRVANMVQNLVRNSERWEKENPGIGKEVREIAREQQQIMERNRQSLNKIQKRNRVIKFLIGANYREIKKVRLEIDLYKKEIEKLEKIKEKLESDEDKQIINEQIEFLNQEIQELEEFLKEEEKRFSLFGWLFRRIFK